MSRLTFALSFVLAISIVGCGPRAELTLDQPHAPSGQKRLRLASDWAYARPDGGQRTILLEFPLPQSQAGPRDFRVFLSVPDRIGEITIRPGDPGAAQGFLIQEVGKLKGKTSFVKGSVTIKKPILAGDKRTVSLNIECADGTRITGKAETRIESAAIDAFGTRYAADIHSLKSEKSGESSEESPETPTASRQSANP